LTAYEKLLKIAGRALITSTKQYFYEDKGPELVDLIISNRVMVDMICEELTVPRDPNTGDAIQFSMSFVKVRMATVGLATITYTSEKIAGTGTEDQLAASTDAGKQQPGEAPAEVRTFWGQVIDLLNDEVSEEK
jgi:hypothetical protein